jgi:tripartite-type tricarboxylate transporter receptor subunit TctC
LRLRLLEQESYLLAGNIKKGEAVMRAIVTLLVVLLVASAQVAGAQTYPTRPVNMIICFPAGAAVDVGARLIAKDAQKFLGQEIVPVNKPGGAGAVGAGVAAAAKPDGYTVMATVSATLTNVPHLESVPFNPLKDFIPIWQYGELIPALIVRADSPYKSFKEIIDFSKKNPGKMTFGTPGVGTSPDLALELIMQNEKVDMAVVPFDGSAPSIAALLGGHVAMAGTSTPAAVPHVKGGKVRVIATTGAKRGSAFPDSPTLVELGFPYAVLVEVYMIAVPKGTPAPVVEKLENAFRKAWEAEEYRTKSRNLFMFPEAPLFGAKLRGFIEEQYARNGEIIKKAKLGK